MIRLYLDHDSSSDAVVDGLRAAGIDVLVSRDADNATLDDESQVAFATSQSRAIYTGNAKDYARLHAQILASGRSHAGIIIRTNHRESAGTQLRALLNICRLLTAEDITNQAVYLSNWVNLRSDT